MVKFDNLCAEYTSSGVYIMPTARECGLPTYSSKDFGAKVIQGQGSVRHDEGAEVDTPEDLFRVSLVFVRGEVCEMDTCMSRKYPNNFEQEEIQMW